jgi:hypothetical protein
MARGPLFASPGCGPSLEKWSHAVISKHLILGADAISEVHCRGMKE